MSNQTSKWRAFWNKSSTPDHIPNKAKFFLAFPVMAIALSNTLIHNAYIKYYSDVIGLDVGELVVGHRAHRAAVDQHVGDLVAVIMSRRTPRFTLFPYRSCVRSRDAAVGAGGGG